MKNISSIWEPCLNRLQAPDLKLKRPKCDFLKWKPHYLHHLILGKGIDFLPERPHSIKYLPVPKAPKEVCYRFDLVLFKIHPCLYQFSLTFKKN